MTLFLIQNAVLPVRKNAENRELLAAGQTGISVFADHFSLRERAIQLDEVCDEISVDDLDLVIDKLAAGAKSLWF